MASSIGPDFAAGCRRKRTNVGGSARGVNGVSRVDRCLQAPSGLVSSFPKETAMRPMTWTAGVLLAAGLAGAADPPVEKLAIQPRVIPRIEWSMPPGTPAEQVKAITDRQKQLQDA